MPSTVCIHGIGQQLKGEETLALEWRAALRDGMRRAGGREDELPPDDSIAVAFYGDLFRGKKAGAGVPYELIDIDEGFESELLIAWSRATGLDEHRVEPPTTKGGWYPEHVQRLARALLRSRFFAELTDRLLVGAIKQVRWYFTEPEMRQSARKRLSQLIGPETRLVMAHSLGSIVAYEVLCCAVAPIAPALITLGSPLGLPNLIFDRLDPRPLDGRGCWPGSTTNWTNIADRYDIVASVKKLAPLFGERVRDVLVDNGALAHDVAPYLTARCTGEAVLAALRAT
jgi:hypothetical protein